MLKSKLGEQEALLFISYIEFKVEQEVQHETRPLATKEDMIKEITAAKSELTGQIYLVGLIEFLAIIGSVIGIMSFMLHK